MNLNLTTMKLRWRLTIAFGSQTSLSAALALLAAWGIWRLNLASADAMLQTRHLRQAQSVLQDLAQLRLSTGRFIAATNDVGRSLAQSEIDQFRASTAKSIADLKAKAKAEPEPGRQLLSELEAQISAGTGSDRRSLDLASQRRNADALALFNTEGQSRFQEIERSGRAFLSWREERLAGAEQAARSVSTSVYRMLLGSVGVIFGLALFFGPLVAHSIMRPISDSIKSLERISHGDLTEVLPEALRAREDEVGAMACAMHRMTLSLRRVLGDIAGGVRTLAASSTELSAVSTQSANGVKATSEKAGAVAAAAEEMSANAVAVATDMEQAATRLGAVASAAEEMTSTIGEIAANSERARAITNQATEQAQRATGSMEQLTQAAQAIGKVTETITTISDQTKLLALNPDIS
jgi:methyl-accepting chemotaxis protein